MFNVCLIQPPIEDFYATTIRNIPLGLLSIGATLKAKHNVQLLDLRQQKAHRTAIPQELRAVIKFYRPNDASPFALYKHYSRFGIRPENIAAAIPKNCDIFLISALFSTYIYEALEIIKIIHLKKPGAIIVAGGSGAMFHAKEFFNSGCDFIIQGEGEIACVRLLDELEMARPDLSIVPNLIWQNANTIIISSAQIIENLDDLPGTDYSIPGTPEYMLNGKRHAMLMASRGCPHRCEFCSIHRVFGTKYRLRSVDNVLAELDHKTRQGFRSFDFEDDHFGGNSRWLNDLLDGIIERFTQHELSFHAMNGITASNLNAMLLEKMKLGGFSGINLSLVTPDQTRQDALKRPFDTQYFTDVVKSAHEIGLQITAYLIIGLPRDTPEDNLKSILFLADLPVLIGPSLFYLVPGTSVFDKLTEESKIPASPRCYRSSYFPYEQFEFSRTAALTLFRICRIINFLKAIREYNYQPSDYRIENDRVVLPPNLSGKQSQITLGFALLELLRQTGKIYGTGKKQGNFYPLVQEKYDRTILKTFVDWLLNPKPD